MRKILNIAILSLIYSSHLYAQPHAQSQCSHDVKMELKQCLLKKNNTEDCSKSKFCSYKEISMIRTIIKLEELVSTYEEIKEIRASMTAPYKNCNK